MMKSTHMLSGALMTEAYLFWLGVPMEAYYLTHPTTLSALLPASGALMAGCVFPDVDLRIKIFGHRTLTHWPIIYLLGGAVSWFYGWMFPLLFCLAALVHIGLDALTKMGVPLFKPFGKRYGLRLLYTGGMAEYGVVAILFLTGWWLL